MEWTIFETTQQQYNTNHYEDNRWNFHSGFTLENSTIPSDETGDETTKLLHSLPSFYLFGGNNYHHQEEHFADLFEWKPTLDSVTKQISWKMKKIVAASFYQQIQTLKLPKKRKQHCMQIYYPSNYFSSSSHPFLSNQFLSLENPSHRASYSMETLSSYLSSSKQSLSNLKKQKQNSIDISAMELNSQNNGQLFSPAAISNTLSDEDQLEKEIKSSKHLQHPFVILFGGSDYQSTFQDVWLLFTHKHWKWKQIHFQGKIPSARHSCASCIINEEFFIMGGMSHQNIPLNDLWKLDLETMIWSEIIPQDPNQIPPPRYGHTMQFLNTKVLNQKQTDDFQLLIFGGVGQHNSYFQDIWTFSFATNSWENISQSVSKLSVVSCSGRAYHTMNSIGKACFLVFGGIKQGQYKKDVFVLDMAHRKWEQVTPKYERMLWPKSRKAHVALTSHCKDLLIVQGGINAKRGCFNDICVLNLQDLFDRYTFGLRNLENTKKDWQYHQRCIDTFRRSEVLPNMIKLLKEVSKESSKLEKNPNDVQTIIKRMELFITAELFSEALEDVNRALLIVSPQSEMTYCYLQSRKAMVLYSLKQFEKVVQNMEAPIRDLLSSKLYSTFSVFYCELLKYRGKSYLLLNKHTLALQDAQSILKLVKPSSKETVNIKLLWSAYKIAAYCCSYLQRFEESNQYLDQAKKLSNSMKHQTITYNNASLEHLEKHIETQKANGIKSQALVENAKNITVLLLKDPFALNKVILELEEVRKLDPLNQSILLQLAKLYLEKREASAAIPLLEKLIEMEATDERVCLLADCWFQKRRIAIACQILQQGMLQVKHTYKLNNKLKEFSSKREVIEKSLKHYHEANELISSNQFTKALQSIEISISYDFENPKLYCCKANAFIGLLQYQDALEVSDVCIKMAPRRYFGYLVKSTVLEAMERYEEAEKSLEIGLLHEPLNKLLSTEMRRVQQQKTKRHKAHIMGKVAIERMLHLNNGTPYVTKYLTYRLMTQREEVPNFLKTELVQIIELLQEAMVFEKLNLELLDNYLHCQCVLGQYGLVASTILERVKNKFFVNMSGFYTYRISLQVAFFNIIRTSLNSLAVLGDFDSLEFFVAKTVPELMAKFSVETKMHINQHANALLDQKNVVSEVRSGILMSQKFFAEKKETKALELLEQIYNTTTNSVLISDTIQRDILYLLVLNFFNQKSYGKCGHYCKKALTQFKFPHFYALYIGTLVGLNQIKEARNQCKEALDIFPFNSMLNQIWHHLSFTFWIFETRSLIEQLIILQQAGDVENGVRLVAAHKKSLPFAELYYLSAFFQTGVGNLRAALQDVNIALKSSISSEWKVFCLYTKGQILLQARKLEEAKAVIKLGLDICSQKKMKLTFMERLDEISNYESRQREAMEWARKAQAVLIERLDTYAEYDTIPESASSEQLEQALSLLSKAIVNYPTNAGFYVKRAAIYFRLSQFDKSYEDTQTALLIDPIHVEASQIQISCLIELEKFDEARTRIVNYGKEIEGVASMKDALDARFKNYEKAEEWFQQAKQSLFYKQFDKAVQLYSQAHRQQPYSKKYLLFLIETNLSRHEKEISSSKKKDILIETYAQCDSLVDLHPLYSHGYYLSAATSALLSADNLEPFYMNCCGRNICVRYKADSHSLPLLQQQFVGILNRITETNLNESVSDINWKDVSISNLIKANNSAAPRNSVNITVLSLDDLIGANFELSTSLEEEMSKVEHVSVQLSMDTISLLKIICYYEKSVETIAQLFQLKSNELQISQSKTTFGIPTLSQKKKQFDETNFVTKIHYTHFKNYLESHFSKIKIPTESNLQVFDLQKEKNAVDNIAQWILQQCLSITSFESIIHLWNYYFASQPCQFGLGFLKAMFQMKPIIVATNASLFHYLLQITCKVYTLVLQDRSLDAGQIYFTKQEEAEYIIPWKKWATELIDIIFTQHWKIFHNTNMILQLQHSLLLYFVMISLDIQTNKIQKESSIMLLFKTKMQTLITDWFMSMKQCLLQQQNWTIDLLIQFISTLQIFYEEYDANYITIFPEKLNMSQCISQIIVDLLQTEVISYCAQQVNVSSMSTIFSLPLLLYDFCNLLAEYNISLIPIHFKKIFTPLCFSYQFLLQEQLLEWCNRSIQMDNWKSISKNNRISSSIIDTLTALQSGITDQRKLFQFLIDLQINSQSGHNGTQMGLLLMNYAEIIFNTLKEYCQKVSNLLDGQLQQKTTKECVTYFCLIVNNIHCAIQQFDDMLENITHDMSAYESSATGNYFQSMIQHCSAQQLKWIFKWKDFLFGSHCFKVIKLSLTKSVTGEERRQLLQNLATDICNSIEVMKQMIEQSDIIQQFLKDSIETFYVTLLEVFVPNDKEPLVSPEQSLDIRRNLFSAVIKVYQTHPQQSLLEEALEKIVWISQIAHEPISSLLELYKQEKEENNLYECNFIYHFCVRRSKEKLINQGLNTIQADLIQQQQQVKKQVTEITQSVQELKRRRDFVQKEMLVIDSSNRKLHSANMSWKQLKKLDKQNKFARKENSQLIKLVVQSKLDVGSFTEILARKESWIIKQWNALFRTLYAQELNVEEMKQLLQPFLKPNQNYTQMSRCCFKLCVGMLYLLENPDELLWIPFWKSIPENPFYSKTSKQWNIRIPFRNIVSIQKCCIFDCFSSFDNPLLDTSLLIKTVTNEFKKLDALVDNCSLFVQCWNDKHTKRVQQENSQDQRHSAAIKIQQIYQNHVQRTSSTVHYASSSLLKAIRSRGYPVQEEMLERFGLQHLSHNIRLLKRYSCKDTDSKLPGMLLIFTHALVFEANVSLSAVAFDSTTEEGITVSSPKNNSFYKFEFANLSKLSKACNPRLALDATAIQLKLKMSGKNYLFAGLSNRDECFQEIVTAVQNCVCVPVIQVQLSNNDQVATFLV